MLVSKSLLSTIASASKDDTRPLLTCIRVYKEGDTIVSVATDGYILSEVIETTPADADYPELPHKAHIGNETQEVLVPATTAKKMIGMMKKNDMLPVLNFALLGNDTISTTDLEQTSVLHFRSPEGNYPEYRELIEREEKKEYVTSKVNPKYLKQVLAMFKDDTDVDISVSADKHAPVFIRSNHNGIKKTAVIMPLRG